VEDSLYGWSKTEAETNTDLEEVKEPYAYYEESLLEADASWMADYEDVYVYVDENCFEEFVEFTEPQPMSEEAETEWEADSE
jgi:hypothetical protein